MAKALRAYRPLIHSHRYARNGCIPESAFYGAALKAQNHVMAYRRKLFATWSDWVNGGSLGYAGTTNMFRFRGHVGYGATKLVFSFALGLDNKNTGTDPRVTVSATEVGGSTVSSTVHHGFNGSVGATDSPSEIAWRKVEIDVNPNTTQEVVIQAIDYARILSFGAWEVASDEIDDTINYFNENPSGLGLPIYDTTRSGLLIGLSNLWRRNGSHLLSWPGSGTSTFPTQTGTTWKNVIDDATSVSSTTAGFYLFDGDETLEAWCRQSDASTHTLDVVLAAYGSTSASTGEVRLENGSGTLCSVTGITTTPGWFTSTTTIAGVDAIDKCDLQFRTAINGPTLTLNAVSLYCYLA